MTHDPPTVQSRGLDALLNELSADESIVAQTVRTIMDTVPGYDGVAQNSLERSTRRNVSLSIRALQGLWSPSESEIPEADTLARERLSQGVALGSLLAGFRVSLSVILSRVLDAAHTYGVSSEEALSCSTVLWNLGDAFSGRALEVYQAAAIEAAVEDSARRMQWIVDSLTTGMARVDLRRGATAYQVPIDQPLRAVCLAAGAGSGTDGGPEPVNVLGAWGSQLLIAPYGSGSIGILCGDVEEADTRGDWIVALGPRVDLEDLPRSYAAAARVLHAAQRTGRRGIVDLDTMSWRMGITASPETTALLCQRLVDPVAAHGEFGELVLESVSACLDRGLSIPRAAAAIPVHVNTLRYRLRRFEELTGADLEALDSLFEIAWALAARAGER